MPRVVSVWAALLAVLSAVAPAAAQDADAAAGAFAEARFEEARTGFRAVVASPSASVPDLARAHRFLAALALMFGDEASAREHARAALTLAESTDVPEGAPDGTRALLEEAAAARGPRTGTLAVSMPESVEAGTPLPVRANLVDAPSLLAGSIELRCEMPRSSPAETRGGGGAVEMRVDTHRLRVGDTVRCFARARTPGGALLREASAEGSVRVSRVGPAPSGGGGAPTWVWIGSGAVLAVAGVVVGILVATSAQDIVVGRVEVEGF